MHKNLLKNVSTLSLEQDAQFGNGARERVHNSTIRKEINE